VIATRVLVLLLLTLAGAAFGADLPSTPALRDPWVPPELRKVAPVPATRGTIAEDVRRKLQASFDAADTARTGTLTREQARRGGFGFLANNFERIDVDGKGTVTFDELLRYLRANGAKL
jgi:hypothetical protein